ncbi:unnamed protein product [Caenorhabditis brenneri]
MGDNSVVLNTFQRRAERLYERWAKKEDGLDAVKSSAVAFEYSNNAYTKSSAFYPYVDRKYDLVILPIFGRPAPFHISMIKNFSESVEGDFTYLRINIDRLGIGFSFRAIQPSPNLSTAFRLIKKMKKELSKPKLEELLIRPNIFQKQITGSLEAHTNGFRYTSFLGDRIDFLYMNIKHAFFEPCDHEMILHFHLKNPIILGGKEYKDVQFYTEVGEITTELGKYHHMQDRDDMQSEQQEREMRRRLNAAFDTFCDEVRRLTIVEFVEFDIPFSGLEFSGVPYCSATKLKPTDSCLVNLTQWPTFIVTLNEVKLVHLKRVSRNYYNMLIIFKDYKAKNRMITLIPITSINQIKTWLDTIGIPHEERSFGNGEWSFSDLESDNEEANDDSDRSDAYDPEEADDSGGLTSESDEDESEREETESDDDEEVSLDSDESEGKYSSDLEEEAAKAGGRWSFSDLETDNEEANDDSDKSDAYDPEEADDFGGLTSESDEDESEGEETESDDDEEASLNSDESKGKDSSDLEEEAAKANKRREVEDRDGGRNRDRKRRNSSKAGPSHKRAK